MKPKGLIGEINCHGDKPSKGANWHLFPVFSLSSKYDLAALLKKKKKSNANTR